MHSRALHDTLYWPSTGRSPAETSGHARHRLRPCPAEMASKTASRLGIGPRSCSTSCTRTPPTCDCRHAERAATCTRVRRATVRSSADLAPPTRQPPELLAKGNHLMRPPEAYRRCNPSVSNVSVGAASQWGQRLSEKRASQVPGGALPHLRPPHRGEGFNLPPGRYLRGGGAPGSALACCHV